MKELVGKWSCRLAVVWVMMLTGCASFPRNQLPTVEKLQPPPEGAKRLNAVYSFSSGVDLFGKQEHQENVRALLEKEFVDVLRESGYFASVTSGNQGEMHIQVRLVNSGTPAAMIPAVITGLSLYTIPSWATDRYNITAKVLPPDGKERTYELADAMTTVQWLPMIVVAPFKNIVSVSGEVRRNIWRHLILKMQQDGLLPKADSPGATSSLDIQVEWKGSA
jgi:hypothetical protein